MKCCPKVILFIAVLFFFGCRDGNSSRESKQTGRDTSYYEKSASGGDSVIVDEGDTLIMELGTNPAFQRR